MIEIMVLSTLTGTLGLQALLMLQWLCWKPHLNAKAQEEEKVLTPYQSKHAPTPQDSLKLSWTSLIGLAILGCIIVLPDYLGYT